MSEKNFKIGSAGLDLDGGLLLTNVLANAVSFNGNLLASQEYVDGAINNIDQDLSDNAGLYLSWDEVASQFDVNAVSLASELTTNQDIATQSFVTSQGYITSAELPAEYTDADAVDAIANVLVSGGGLEYVANTGFQVDTDIIASKSYVDSVAQGLDVKASVYAATTSATTISDINDISFVMTVDGTIGIGSLPNGARVLIKDGVGSSNNGIYVWDDQAYTFTRAADALPADTLTKGAFTFVENGANAGKGFVADIGGTGGITWSQFSEAGSLTAGTNIYLESGSINVNVNSLVGDLDGTGLYVADNQLAVNVNALISDIDANGYLKAVDGEVTVPGSGDFTITSTENIVLNSGTNKTVYLEDASVAGNEVATKSYVDSAVNTNAIAGSLASSTLYVGNGDDLNVNVNAIVADLDGAGLYVDGVTLAVNTNVIATKSYVDSVAQGLDVKASVMYASTANLDNDAFVTPGVAGSALSAAGISMAQAGDRVLIKSQTEPAENGIYVISSPSVGYFKFDRTSDAIIGDTLSKGAFVFVENGDDAGRGFVATQVDPGMEVTWSQFSEAGSLTAGTNIYLENNQISVNVNSLVGDIAGSGLYVSGNDLAVNVNALAGTGLTVNGNQLEAAPAFITTVDESFAVTDGELSLSDTITIASVELTDSVANVTAASDVFGNASESTYAMGSAVTIGTLPTGADVADVFVTLKATDSGNSVSRTSKLTYVNTGGDAPTWTEYGIIVSGAFPSTTVGFDSSGNITANVTGSDTYSAKGVATILK
jgi:hypothetical protein